MTTDGRAVTAEPNRSVSDLLKLMREAQHEAKEARKRAERQNRLAVKWSRLAESYLEALCAEYGISVEITHARPDS